MSNTWHAECCEPSGKCQGKILSGKSCLKVFIVSCTFVSIQVFSTSTNLVLHCFEPQCSTGMIWVTLDMPSAAEECREPSENCQRISHCLESGHPVINHLKLSIIHIQIWINTNIWYLVEGHPLPLAHVYRSWLTPVNSFTEWDRQTDSNDDHITPSALVV